MNTIEKELLQEMVLIEASFGRLAKLVPDSVKKVWDKTRKQRRTIQRISNIAGGTAVGADTGAMAGGYSDPDNNGFEKGAIGGALAGGLAGGVAGGVAGGGLIGGVLGGYAATKLLKNKDKDLDLRIKELRQKVKEKKLARINYIKDKGKHVLGQIYNIDGLDNV